MIVPYLMVLRSSVLTAKRLGFYLREQDVSTTKFDYMPHHRQGSLYLTQM